MTHFFGGLTLWNWLCCCSAGIFRVQVIQSLKLSPTIYRTQWFMDTCHEKYFVTGNDSGSLECSMSSVYSSYREWEITCEHGIFPPSVGLGGAVRFRQGLAWEAVGWEWARRRPGKERTWPEMVPRALRKSLYFLFLMPYWSCIMRVCIMANCNHLKSFSLVTRRHFFFTEKCQCLFSSCLESF